MEGMKYMYSMNLNLEISSTFFYMWLLCAGRYISVTRRICIWNAWEVIHFLD